MNWMEVAQAGKQRVRRIDAIAGFRLHEEPCRESSVARDRDGGRTRSDQRRTSPSLERRLIGELSRAKRRGR